MLLTYSITLIWSRGIIFSPVRHSNLSILSYDNANIFAAFLLISYCSFSSPILLSIVKIIFYILSKIFFLKHKGLSDVRVVSITKNEYDFAGFFLLRFIKSLKSAVSITKSEYDFAIFFFVKIHKVFKVNIW